MTTATSDFDVPQVPSGRRNAPDRRRARAFAQARRHSVVVRVLRLLMPVAAVACLGLYLLGGPISLSIGEGTLSIEELSVKAKNLQMSNPVYEGFTDDNGRYIVKAVSATQQISKPDLVKLQTVSAKLTQVDGRTAEMTAKTGEIDTKKEILKLGGGIAIASSDGMKAKLASATLKLKTKKITSTEPVEVEMPNGTVRSRALDIDTETKRILFKTQVVTHLVPPPPKAETAKAAPPKPAGFAASAGFGDGPIDITSDLLDIRDTEKLALFSGHVVANQNGTTFASPTMTVSYTGESALSETAKDASAEKTAAPAAGTEISKIESKGGVVITTAEGRSASGEWSVYDRVAGTVQLGGGVTLTDESNELTGDLLVVDLAKGISRFPPGGRVKGRMGDAEAGKGKAKGKAAKKKPKPQKAGPTDLTSFTADSGGPMTIESDSLEVNDAKGSALFSGDVIANRGGQQIKAKSIAVSYVASGTGALPEGQDNIRRIVADGNVVVSAPDDQVVTGDKLDYDAKTSIITISGNVTTTKGKNVIKGDKLVVNLETGESSFDTDPGAVVQGAQKRIKMLINPDELPQSPN
ncbi:MAG: LPS export ABC transporter periplasmic protein LptC [Hyphomicrobiaceae bacterium]